MGYLVSIVSFFLSFFLFFLSRDINLLFHLFMYLVVLVCALTGKEPATLAYGRNALTNWATWPRPIMLYFLIWVLDTQVYSDCENSLSCIDLGYAYFFCICIQKHTCKILHKKLKTKKISESPWKINFSTCNKPQISLLEFVIHQCGNHSPNTVFNELDSNSCLGLRW